jgi:hypothetical protein
VIHRIPLLVRPSDRDLRRDWKRPPRGWSPRGGAGIAFLDAHFNTGSASTASTTITVTAASIPVGSTIVVSIAMVESGLNDGLLSCGDSGGNVYTFVNGGADASAVVYGEMWVCASTTVGLTSASTINLSWVFSSGTNWGVGYSAYSGVAAKGINSFSAPASGANPSVSLTTQDSNNWVVAAFAGSGNLGYSALTGNLRESNHQGNDQALNDNTVAVAGACVNAVTNADLKWAIVALELRSVVSAAAVPTGRIRSQSMRFV